VLATHLGLGFNHEVWKIIADRLAQPHPLDPAGPAVPAVVADPPDA
jgi:hypothetical protein